MADAFAGTTRFSVTRRLGAGGAGIVYEAQDQSLGMHVALKRLKRLSPDAILRFKKEFRAIEDVEHPNLVSLGELFEEEGQWFFTMEFVDGVDFLAWVRRLATAPAGDSTESDPTVIDRASARPPRSRDAGVFDEPRLRDALAQLLRGLGALHRAKKVHRDVKPGNVLVTSEGRVVLLDFGLATDAQREAPEEGIVGTPSYMAPEQRVGLAPTAAADLYSVGVMLYRALTGRLPTSPLVALGGDVPEDLDALCMDLLRETPELRPSTTEALRRIGKPEAEERAWVAVGPRSFVGRELELAVLREAFDETLRGACRSISVVGASGLGKSTLSAHFGRIVEGEYGAIVLAGRCFERETMPFKAVDGIMDALGRKLATLPRREHVELFGEGSAVLAHAFPALRPFASAVNGTLPADPRERRVALFAAVRALFTALANRFPVVLVVDDLQWSDADGKALLHEVLRGPEGPSLLAISTARTKSGDPAVHEIELGPLDRRDARTLALEALGGREDLADAIAEESQGHPLFVDTLAASAKLDRDRPVRLDEALADRVSRLDVRWRHVVEAASVAGAPLALDVLAKLTEPETLARAVRGLSIAKLLRTMEERTVVPYHDRVRDAVTGSLTPATKREWHRRLAEAMKDGPDVDAVASHFAAAGEDTKAAHYTEIAADRAVAALAFGRAATLLRWLVAREPNASALHAKLAEALVAANRGTEAAEAFLEAARRTTGDRALDLERRAAEQLLTSGHLERGLASLKPVLEASGLRTPETRAGVVASFLLGRARLAVRGFAFEERPEAEVPRRILRRIDALGVASGALGMVDTVRGAALHAQHLLAALEAGEPRRLSRAMAFEASFCAASGQKNRKRTAQWCALAIDMATRCGDPLTIAQARTAGGIAAFFEGRFPDARAILARSESEIRERTSGAGMAFALANVNLYSLGALLHCGELNELARRLPPLLADAEERGDRYALVHMRSSIAAYVRLTKADPDGARREAREALAQGTQARVQMPTFFDVLAQAQIDLYEGKDADALERTEVAFRALHRAMLLRVQFVRVKMLELRARAALACGHVRAMERDVAALAKEDAPWANALGALVAASSTDGFAAVARTFDSLGMKLHAAVARFRAGEIDAIQGVDEPVRFATMLSPRRVTRATIAS